MTVVRRERAQRVPGCLSVIMAVVVDKAGCHHLPRGVDRALRRAAQLAEFDDLAVLDADIAAEGRRSRAVDDATILDQQVIGHPFPFLRSGHDTRFLYEECSMARRSLASNCGGPAIFVLGAAAF